MARSFKPGWSWRDPRVAARAILGTLLAANLAAALVVLRLWGSSPEDLERQLAGLRDQLRQRKGAVERMRLHASKADKARAEGDRFLTDFFLARRSAYSTLAAELGQSARTAGIRPKEHAFNDDLIEGSETLGMVTITANYEGTYADLIEFINLLDRSRRLMIIESLSATPQPSGGLLNVSMKVNTFVRDSSEASASGAPAVAAPPADEASGNAALGGRP